MPKKSLFLFQKRFKLVVIALLFLAVCYYYRYPIYHWGYQQFGFLNYDVPTLHFHTEPEYVLTIKRQREKSLNEGWITTDKRDLVPTKIDLDGRIIQAQYRLKGDYIEHALQEKCSYRVEAADTVFGKLKFSLHKPIRRNNLNEFFWQFACAKEGLIRLDYDLVQLSVNEDNFGLYALEEHFGHNFCSRRNLSGFVLRFEEKEYWNQKISSQPMSSRKSFESAAIDSYSTPTIKKNAALWKEHEVIIAKLHLWRAGIIPLTSVFDPYKLATYFALADLCSGHHALVWHNLRFYYRPETGLLEPIAYDGDLFGTIESPVFASENRSSGWHFSSRCLGNKSFESIYKKELARIADNQYLHDLLRDFKGEQLKYENILQWEYPRYSFNANFLINNLQTIQSNLIH